jgi:hypothetical protein
MALLDDERELRSVGSTDPLELEVPVGESTNNVGHEPSRVNTSSVSATNETHSPQRAGAPSAVGSRSETAVYRGAKCRVVFHRRSLSFIMSSSSPSASRGSAIDAGRPAPLRRVVDMRMMRCRGRDRGGRSCSTDERRRSPARDVHLGLVESSDRQLPPGQLRQRGRGGAALGPTTGRGRSRVEGPPSSRPSGDGRCCSRRGRPAQRRSAG